MTHMSLIRQIRLLLLATLVFSFAGGLAVNLVFARNALQDQLRLKNVDNAASLALVLSQKTGQRESLELAAAQFDAGLYRRIRFIGASGETVFQREAAAVPPRAPAWFVRLVPIESVAGLAQVSARGQAPVSIEVIGQSASAHDELWQGSVRSTLALAMVGLVGGLLAALAVARIRRPLDAMVDHAASLQRGQYILVAEPKVPELRRLAGAMNSLVARLRVVAEAQAAQVDSMRRQASCDELTGLSNRTHFMAQLSAALHREDGTAAGGLVFLRVLKLAEVNNTLGRDSTDRLLGSIAQTLQAYTDRVDGAFVGRLNGSDFALALPAGGVAVETAQAVVELLRAALRGLAGDVGVAAGAVEMYHGAVLSELLGAADLALAQAESSVPFSVESASVTDNAWAGFGERGWRERVRDALREGRVQLGSFPVVDAMHRLLHLECPLRLQLQPQGPFAVAAYWLPLAIRSRLTCEADERALALALDGIARDGQPRCVNLSQASLADGGFAGRLLKQLQARPRAARDVWLEVSETAAVDQFELVRELGRQLRPAGVRFGLEHAGDRLSRLDRLFEAGLDYVKLDAAVTQGVATDPARAGFVKGLTTMLHSLSLQVIAEGVSDAEDARSLWAAGVDGMTGPWVRMAQDVPAG